MAIDISCKLDGQTDGHPDRCTEAQHMDETRLHIHRYLRCTGYTLGFEPVNLDSVSSRSSRILLNLINVSIRSFNRRHCVNLYRNMLYKVSIRIIIISIACGECYRLLTTYRVTQSISHASPRCCAPVSTRPSDTLTPNAHFDIPGI